MNLHANPGSGSFVTQLRCLFSRVQCANATFMATNQQPQREVQAHHAQARHANISFRHRSKVLHENFMNSTRLRGLTLKFAFVSVPQAYHAKT